MPVIELPTPDPRTLDDLSRPFAEAVASQYAIKRLIGRGGMGIVYLARDRRLDRLVAIKTLLPQLADDPAIRERFIRETRAAGGMSHPNIVPVHGADEIDGHVFFVMGYVDGESLATHIGANGHLHARDVTRLMRDVASALAHAHRRGIIHRDIKAENILIEKSSGQAVVTDFGIARLAEAKPLTATGQLLGTVYYVSPEQVAGEPIDQRSDLYSVGVVGYLASTGRFPFEADVASAVLVAHVTRPAPSVRATNPNVPRQLAEVIDRCLAKKPADRFASADELLAALANVVFDDARAAVQPNLTLVSDTEAHSVWQRAADLQAFTGVRPRPEPVSRVRDREKDHSRNSGFSVKEIRAAADEAGIASHYVDHALEEHGLMSGRSMSAHPVPKTATRRSLWAGVPLDIVVDAEMGAAVDAQNINRLINTLREGTATLGTTEARHQELKWRTGWFGHRLFAEVWPENGKTRIRLTQSVRRSAVAAISGSLVGGSLLGVAVGVAVDVVMRLPAPYWSIRLDNNSIAAIATAAGVLVALPSLRAARLWLRRAREINAARLHTLAELLTFKAESDEADQG